MADTVRTTAQLQALFADGQAAHSTNRQMIRDFIASFDVTRAAVINVLDAPYFADKTGASDSSVAIVAAVTSANAISGGATILCPPGVYLWGTDLECPITNSGVWIVMPGSYPGKQSGDTSNRGFGIKLGANQSGSIFRFKKDSTSRVTSGCGIKVPFLGDARSWSVTGACVNVEYSDNFYHECSYYGVKGRGLWTQGPTPLGTQQTT